MSKKDVLASVGNAFNSITNGAVIGAGFVIHSLLKDVETMTAEFGATVLAVFVSTLGIVGTLKQLSEGKRTLSSTAPMIAAAGAVVAGFEYRDVVAKAAVDLANTIG